jgi:hypothetical protein
MEDLMYSRIPPVAASVIVAAVAALLFAAVTNLPLRMIHRATALNTAMFLGLAAFVGFLGRLSGKHYRDLLAPLLILSAVLVAAGSVTGFVIPAAAGLSWIRSGICFPGPIRGGRSPKAILCAAGLSLVSLQPPAFPAGR